jgi:hypothetical protein
MPNVYGQLAYNIWDSEFYDDETSQIHRRVETDNISGWLESNVGQLNVLLDTTFSGGNPTLTNQQSGIFHQMFLQNWYEKQTRSVLKGVTQGSDMLEIQDEDGNKFTRHNRNVTAQVYKKLGEEAGDRLDSLITQYKVQKFNEVGPVQVAGDDGL